MRRSPFPSRLAPVWKGVVFAVASALAVSFPLVFGRFFWAGGLSGGAEFLFWPASGVNVAALLLLGRRYWPVIYAGVIPAWFFFGQSASQCFLGATGNVVEALLAWWILHRLGDFRGGFERTRTVLALILAAVAAPLLGALAIPALLVLEGRFTLLEYWMGLGNWTLANGTAILVLAPLFVALRRGAWIARKASGEAALWVVAGLLCGLVAFDAVFQTRGVNFAFLMFPFVIFVAVRFGQAETSAALGLGMATLYLALARHALQLAPAAAPGILWFVQAFSWVLAATGLLVASLVAERREAQAHARAEEHRALEASLREERARLDALRYQINPHFLFNTLNSLRATLPLEAKTPREMVTELAAYLRSTLEEPKTDLTPLKEEAAAVENYLAIEKKRFGEALRVEMEITPEAGEALVPVFLLQPLVENAIRHGLEAAPGLFRLAITATGSPSAGEPLRLEVANTGVWKEAGERTGLGLENIRRRLALLYGRAATLKTVSAGGWVRIQVIFPCAPAPVPARSPLS